jgi:seryl-tRNA synthetase
VPRAQVALAWVLQQPGITSPIIGATKLEHLDDAVAALSMRLSAEEIAALEAKPAELKALAAEEERHLLAIEPEWKALWLQVPQPPSADVPKGKGSDDNIEIRRWAPAGWDFAKSFAENRGFKPRTHLELVKMHHLVDFERGVKMGGTRHYVLTGLGMRLHQAVLRYAVDFMADKRGFTPMGVPVIVKEECMQGTGFFPFGREQAYHIEESARGSGHDLFLTGTGEVGLMGIHADEILPDATRRESDARHQPRTPRTWNVRLIGHAAARTRRLARLAAGTGRENR